MKISTAFFLCAFPLVLLGQTNNFPTNGDVTINDGNLIQTGSSNYMSTQGPVKLKNYLLLDSDGDFTGGNYFTIQDDPTGNYLRIGYGFASNLTINSSGNIGIGTNQPNATLEINKNFDGSTSAFILNQSTGANSRTILLLGEQSTGGNYGYLAHYGGNYVGSWGDYVNANTTWFVGADSNGLGIIAGNSQGKIFFGTGSSEKMRLTANGYLGIGTKNPDSKLTVKGNIHAEEIKVDLSVPGPDYVFKKGYDLKSLEEVQNYIQEHGHLPNIPSAKEMEANGIQLGEMNMKLLEKIEELTLYTLEQEEKLIKQQELLKELDAFKERVEKLEKLLNNTKQ